MLKPSKGQMGNFWQNLASGRVYKKPSEEVERQIKRAILSEWSEQQEGKVKPAVIRPSASHDNLEQLRGQVNFLNNKVTELRAEKRRSEGERPDYK